MKAILWFKFLKMVLWDEGVIRKTANILLIILTILAIIFSNRIEWPYWMLMLLILFFAWWFFTFIWAYKKWSKELSQNWVEYYRIEHGKLPVLPKYLEEVVENYTPGQPITKKIKVKSCSMQHWKRLDPTQQDKLLELAEWTGTDRRDYLARMDRMRPPGPRIRWL